MRFLALVGEDELEGETVLDVAMECWGDEDLLVWDDGDWWRCFGILCMI